MPETKLCEVTHEEKLTLSVDVFIPGHDERVTTPLFSHSRTKLLERDGARCFVCGETEQESGHPLEAHHWLVERALANAADWPMVREMVFKLEGLIGHAATFCRENEQLDDVMAFVDDMRVNGQLLCKFHHTGKGGIHVLPGPLWNGQVYGKAGYQFSPVETIVHEEAVVQATASVTVPASDTPTEVTLTTEAAVVIGSNEGNNA